MGIKLKQNAMLLFYIVLYLAAIIFSKTGQHLASGLLLFMAAVGLFLHYFLKTGQVVNMPGLLSLSWVGGQAVASLKLSSLQRDWSWITWLCFFLFHVCFLAGYSYMERRKKRKQKGGGGICRLLKFLQPAVDQEKQLRRLLAGIIAVTAVSAAAFLLEAAVLGYIPVFVNMDKPHLYSEFHISGVHYFTVSCALVLPFTSLYLCLKGIRRTLQDKGLTALLAICNLAALAIPVLCISRQQLIMSFGVSAIVILKFHGRIPGKQLAAVGGGALAVLLCGYLALTYFRGFDASMLNEMAEMKDQNMPLLVTQPYIYIANNYENFDYMVEHLPGFTFGAKQLFPVWAFTGLKFVIPQYTQFPLYVTKDILTTLTVIYDAYYDFGVAGVAGFGLLLGVLSCWLNWLAGLKKNPVAFLLYGEVAIYLLLSFFTTWFSNPTIWFWIGSTVILYWAVGFERRRENAHE